VFSLVGGLLSEVLAEIVKPHIEVLIALLLFNTCLRVGPQQALGALNDIKANLLFTLVLQVLLPVTLILIFWVANIRGALPLALILLTAAPAISGGPHLVALLGFDPAPTLRQLIIGTLLLPLTIIPVLLLIPDIGGIESIIAVSTRLLIIILCAGLSAFAVRHYFLPNPSRNELQEIDGVSTLLLAIVVFGLMAAIHSEIETNPLNLLTTLAVAVSANFGLQIITALTLASSRFSKYGAPIGLIAGNRNIALFMTALAVTSTQPILVFIACYQIPMYLTPVVMGRFYRRLGSHS
jgi:predicted Na+-dependent transporter